VSRVITSQKYIAQRLRIISKGNYTQRYRTRRSKTVSIKGYLHVLYLWDVFWDVITLDIIPDFCILYLWDIISLILFLIFVFFILCFVFDL
jgi:hypothetical protein